jgi:RHS repeat-associated protein
MVSVALSNSTFSYGTTVSIINPDGTTLTSINTYGWSSISLGPIALSAAGTYTVVISSSSGYAITGSATVTVILTAIQSTPIISWAAPASVSFGTPLSATQLNATASVPGTFVYTPAVGTVLTAGPQTLSVTFTPTDATDFTTATATVALTVYPATPTITWAAPAAITYGAALSSTQLNAAASVPGTFAYSPVAGAVLTAGPQSLSVTFTPTDTTNYTMATDTVVLTVNPLIPTITWATPEAMTYGMALSSSQLNATANVPGTFSYQPDAGTVPDVGPQTLWATFTPTDTIDYTTATASVVLTVSPPPIITVAGGGSGCDQQTDNVGDGCPATSAQLNWPQGTAVDGAGNLYIADTGNNRIRKVSASTGIITTVAGTGYSFSDGWVAGGYSGDGGPAIDAELNSPTGVAIDSAGDIFIADEGNNCIREVMASTGFIYTVAGYCIPSSSQPSYCCDGIGATGSSVNLSATSGVAVDPSGNLYIADSGEHLINKVDASTNTLSTLAQESSTVFHYTVPPGIALDSSGNIYFADSGACSIREISASSGIITTVAGGNYFGQSDDGGLATNTSLCDATGVAVDGRGNIYIDDSLDNTVREVTASSGIIYTVAGNGMWGFSGDGGPATSAELAMPTGVAVDASGHLYIADSGNNRIRKVTLTRLAPAITWQDPAPIAYGTALSATELNASANVQGTFTYSPALGSILKAGSNVLSVTLTPDDTTDYETVTATVPLTVYPSTPNITWATLAPISNGTALSATQLGATSTISGAFVYSPAAGTVLSVGPHTLSVTFVPTDSINYSIATAINYITVTQGTSTFDAGTVTLTVQGITAATTTYAAGATPSTIAAGLASGITPSSFVNITAIDDDLYLTSKQAGAGTNYSYSLQTTSYDSAHFGQPSFLYPAVTGNLEGGVNANADGSTVYQYTVPQGGYDYAGNLLNYTDLSGTQPVMGTWNFNYDTLNRLVSGGSTAGPYAGQNLCWGYDAFGNRTAQSLQSGACPTLPSQPSPTASYNANNQISWTTFNAAVNGFAYDQAGDVVNDNVNQYLYDGDGRICAVASTPVTGMTVMTGYIYDAGGTRVSKGSITAWSCDPGISGFKAINDYILGPGGEQITEMGVNTSAGNNTTTLVWQHTNVYAAGALIGTYDNNGLHFYLNDPLGTRRAQTDYAGVLEQTCQSLPSGDTINNQPPCSSGSLIAPTEQFFTGKERDAESGNDYFGARYYSSAMGRFMSPDWSAKVMPVPYAVLGDPQSLNLYAYVRNNPITRLDLDGHCWGGGWCDIHGNPYQTDSEKEAAMKQARTQNAASGSGSGGPSFSVGLGNGYSVSGTFGKFDSTQCSFCIAGLGATIDAHSNCSGCLWVQVVARTGADSTAGTLDNSALSGTPFYPNSVGGGGGFWDQPKNWMRGDWSKGGGTFSAVSVLGTADLANHTFHPVGAISWGYSASAAGKLTVSPPTSTPGRISEAMMFMLQAMPSWSGN